MRERVFIFVHIRVGNVSSIPSDREPTCRAKLNRTWTK
jgi:hypothetical protein